MLLNSVRQQLSNSKSRHLSYSMFHSIRTLLWKETQGIPAIFLTENKQGVSIFWKSKTHFSNAQVNLNKHSVKTFFKNKEEKGRTAKAVVESGSVSGEAWEDTFGNLTDTSTQDTMYSYTYGEEKSDDITEEYSDDESEEDDRPLRVIYRKLSPHWYSKQMKKYAKEGKIDKAIDVLKVIMLKNDRIRPLPTHYHTLICLISKTGDTKKAFHFYKRMRDFGYEPAPKVFTALFDGCSKSIYGKEDGLRRASKLIHTLKAKNITPNQTTFNAMIKAFGMLGQTEIALHLADQSLRLYPPDDQTFANILMAAAGEEDSGFALAVGIWRIARLRKIEPTIFHYQLLLRALRCCGVGDRDAFYQLLLQTSPFAMQENLQQILTEFQNRRELTSDFDGSQLNRLLEGNSSDDAITGDDSCLDIDADSTTTAGSTEILNSKSESNFSLVSPPLSSVRDNEPGNFPDVLKPGEILLGVLNMHRITNKYDRLQLLGGVKGFLARMERDGIAPTLAVFGQLFHIIDTFDEEEYLFSVMEKLDVTPDIDIISHAMLKRLRRLETVEAKGLVDLMHEKGLLPNIFVLKYLAYIECKDGDTLREFLEELQRNDLPLDVYMLNGLMKASQLSLGDKKYLLQLMDDQDIHPTQYFLKTMHDVIGHARERIRRVEMVKGNCTEAVKEFNDFKTYFEQWLMRVPMQE